MKKQAEYTLSDVIRLDPKWLRAKQRQDDGSLARYDENILFLSNMMSSGRTEIASYYFLDVFPDKDISQHQIPDINKALFIYEEGNKPQVRKRLDNPNLKLIREAVKQEHLNTSAEHLEDARDALQYRLREAQVSVNDARRSAERHYTEFLRYETRRKSRYTSIALIQEHIEAMEDKIANFNGGIDKDKLKVLKAIPKHYRILETTKDTFTVANVLPIILTETNAAAGINRTLNLGHYTYSFKWDMSYAGIRHLADNITGVCARHPHVSGYICWGNLDNIASQKLENEDYEGWWVLFDQLQANYNAGSPFAAWEVYAKKKNSGYSAMHGYQEWRRTGIFEELYHNSTSSRFREAYENVITPKARKET